MKFCCKGKRVITPGWKEVYSNDYEDDEDDDISEQRLPVINKGDKLKVSSVQQTKGEN